MRDRKSLAQHYFVPILLPTTKQNNKCIAIITADMSVLLMQSVRWTFRHHATNQIVHECVNKIRNPPHSLYRRVSVGAAHGGTYI